MLKEPSPANPRPDIILMDVQMPIMDGYKATHTIRTQEPYRDRIRHIPIVAMTASAIQGDKEKCQKAGMDDYLSKPVRGNVLEKMLLKWTLHGRRSSVSQQRHESPGLESNYSLGSSAPSRTHSPPPSSSKTPMPIVQGSSAFASMTPARRERLRSVDGTVVSGRQQAKGASPPASLSYTEKSQLKSVTTESANASQRRNFFNEEKASSLRDDKMLSVTTDPRSPHQLLNSEDERRPEASQGPSHKLTRENLDRHTSDQVLNQEARYNKKQNEESLDRDSLDSRKSVTKK